jgi:hypothetical protein
MGLIESIQSGISRAIWKGVKHAGTAVAGVATALLVKKLNFELSADHQIAIAVAITGVLGTALKMLKDKFPKQFGWL